MAFGILYWMIPRMLRSRLWSPGAATAHFWIAMVGLILLASPLYYAGFTQGQMWMGLDNSGQLAHPEFVDGLTQIKPLWFVSLCGLAMFGAGILILIANVAMTLIVPSELSSAESSSELDADSVPTQFASPLEGAPVLALAVGIDRMSTFEWHRQWERHPVRPLCWGVRVSRRIEPLAAWSFIAVCGYRSAED